MSKHSSSSGSHVLVLDEPLLGLDEFLRDLGWKTVKVKQGTTDDDVLKLAKTDEYVVITPDRRLVSRCRLQGVKVVDVGLEDLARRIHQILVNDLGIKPRALDKKKRQLIRQP